jgi:hypothetical protein
VTHNLSQPPRNVMDEARAIETPFGMMFFEPNRARMNCSIAGCIVQIPVTKGSRKCYGHERRTDRQEGKP